MLYAGLAPDRFTPPGAMKLLRVFNRKTPDLLSNAVQQLMRSTSMDFGVYSGSFQKRRFHGKDCVPEP